MTKAELIAFEKDIAECFERGEIKGPVHLSGGNEDQLIEIFKEVLRTDWVFSTWRNHYHALLHGISPERLKAAILRGPSMNINFPDYRFVTSAIVGGILPIACGVAAGIKRRGEKDRVWCFVGDMAATTGICAEVSRYAQGHSLPLHIVIEDNWYSTNAPTSIVWGASDQDLYYERYHYERVYPHYGIGKLGRF